MKKVIKKTLSIMLAVVVMVGLIPAINVSAADAKPVISQKTMVLFLKESSYSGSIGGKYTVEPKGYLNIANGAGKQKWTSSNKKVATVSQHGTVTGKKKGTATITCTTGGKKLTCKVTVKDMPSKITKGISVSYKKVKNYVVATYKNTLGYPVLIHGGIVQYDKDGKKIENFGMQDTASIRVSAKSSVKFYIMLADNCSYYEKEKISGQVDIYGNDMYMTADAKTISLTDVVAENSCVYWRENKSSPFEYNYDAQILSFDEEGNLLGTVHCATSTDWTYAITEDGMRYSIEASYAELVAAANKVKTNVYECTIKVQNND